MELFSEGTVGGTVGIILGGLATKLIAYRSRKEEIFHKETETIRSELRSDIQELQNSLHTLSKDLDQWKEKYFLLREENSALSLRCQMLEAEVLELRNTLERRMDEVH